MLVGMMIANAVRVVLGALLLHRLERPVVDRTPVENFAAVLQAIRPTAAGAAAAPTWMPWTRKETRPC